MVDNVTDAWKAIPPPDGNPHMYSYIFGSIQTFEGSDPCALRQNMGSRGYYDIMVEEEASADAEMTHAAEKVGILRLFRGFLL